MTHDGARWARPLPLTYFKTAVLERTSPDAADLGGEGTQLPLTPTLTPTPTLPLP